MKRFSRVTGLALTVALAGSQPMLHKHVLTLIVSMLISRAILLGGVLITVAAQAAGSVIPFTPATLFKETIRAEIDTQPIKVQISGDDLVILGSNQQTSRGEILIVDARSLQRKAIKRLPVIPQDMAIDKHGNLFVVGADVENHSRLLVLNNTLKELTNYDTNKTLIEPVLSLPGVDTLIVGSMNEPMIIMDTVSPENIRPSATFKAPGFATGVGDTWTSADYKTLFVNLSSDLSLVAYDIASARRLDAIGYTIKGNLIEPYRTFAVTGEYPCHSAVDISFLIWDTRRESLTLAEFDPIFRSLDIQTAIETRLGAGDPGVRDMVPGVGVFRPSGLLASNCEQTAILLGSLRSSRIIQYAVNKEYRSLEKTGTIDAPFAPVSMSMNPDGAFAILASEDSLLVRYEPRVAASEPYTLGDPAVRELQRLLTDNGYPVGSIDGILGPATRRALALYEKNRGVQLDLNNLTEVIEKSRENLR